MKKTLGILFVLGIVLFALAPVTAWAESQNVPSYDLSMFDEHGAIIMLVNPETGRILYANAAASSYFGYAETQLETMFLAQVISPASNETDAVMKELQKGASASLTFEHRLPNGDTRNAELFSNPIVYQGRQMLLVIVHDITALTLLAEREKSTVTSIIIAGAGIIAVLVFLLFMTVRDRKKLRINKQEILNFNDLRQAFINADDSLIYLKDENLKYVFVNRAFESFFQIKAEEVVGLDDFTLRDDDFSRKRRETDLAVQRKGTLVLDEEESAGRVYKTTKFPVRMPNGSYGVGAYKRDITEERGRVRSLQKVMYRQKILADILTFNNQNMQEQLDYVLHQSLLLTESQYGYIYLYDEESREFTLNSWTNGVMADCAVLEQKTKYQLDSTGIWGEVVRQRKPILVNDFEQANPLKKGYPNGHVGLKKYMSIPVVVDNRIVAVVGLANKPSDYDDNDVSEMILLMTGVWNALKRREAQVSLSIERNKFKQIIFSIGDGVMVVNNSGSIEMLNTVAQKLVGWNMEDAIGRHYRDVFVLSCDRGKYTISDPIAGVLETDMKQELSGHAILTSKDGTLYGIEDSAAPIKDDTGATRGVVVVFRDITEKKAQIDKIEYLSYHDPLTGLYNRRFFEEEFHRLDTERNLPLSIIMGDVNDLKLTNDVFGHMSGDELLNKAAEVLKKTCRADDIIARWGGDEFVILLPKTSVEETEKLIARIENELTGEQIHAIKVSMSLGCDAKQNTVDDILHVLNRAEGKMYQSKTLEREKVRSEAISAMITTLHKNSIREKDHSRSVSELCQELGRALNLDEVEILKLKEAGFLHDIGKIVLAPRLLNESNQLNSQEWDEMRVHPTIGYRILSTLDDTMDLAKSVLAHHEHWDGSGYPKGLKEDEIPLMARIIAVVESYDRMVNRANAERAMERRDAIAELKSSAGTKYEPAVVDAFIQMMENLSMEDGG